MLFPFAMLVEWSHSINRPAARRLKHKIEEMRNDLAVIVYMYRIVSSPCRIMSWMQTPELTAVTPVHFIPQHHPVPLKWELRFVFDLYTFYRK